MASYKDPICDKNPLRSKEVDDDEKQQILCFEKVGENAKEETLKVVHFSKEDARKAIVKFIMMSELSFRHVESKPFKNVDSKVTVDNASKVTVDNASSNERTVSHLKKTFSEMKERVVLGSKFFHIRCCAHIINLIISEG